MKMQMHIFHFHFQEIETRDATYLRVGLKGTRARGVEETALRGVFYGLDEGRR